tara:strand:+ start:7238 stop:7999 length:762 start_codon:yes stop_codon:yes gene_type:complete
MASYNDYDIQIRDIMTGEKMSASGGVAYITTSGGTAKATLYNPDADYAALSNPIALTNGRLRFAVLGASTFGQASEPQVDIYGMSAEGIAFQRRGWKPGMNTISVDNTAVTHTLIVPFNIADTSATAETDTGFDFTAGMAINPLNLSVYTKTLDATETINVGLLSSESGGDADGFAVTISVATAVVVTPTLAASAETLGALLRVAATADAGTGLVPRQHVIATAVSLTYTLTAGTDTAAGFINIGYSRPIVPA